MKRYFALMICCLLLLCAFFIPVESVADFGDFSGDSDWGGGSGSDWGGSDWDSDDWGSDYSYYGGGTIDSDGGGGFVYGLIIFIIIVVLVFSRKKKGASSQPVRAGGQRTSAEKLQPIETYVQKDPNFNIGDVSEKFRNLYIQMQNAWQDKDITPIRPYMSDAYYAQMERQVQAYIRNGQTNYIERPTVLTCTIRGWYTQEDDDCLVVYLNTRIIDYVIDDKTGQVIRGNKTAECFMEYEWILTRPTGYTTRDEGDVTVHNCPNCGAPLNINSSAKCPYCDTVVTVEEHDWVLSNIIGISQRRG
ncbi:MAG: Tim44 domain-containing protein [Clostridia bacterium]|nr:Tim44 domain-containing protein [Clostridia bacterium]